MVYNEWHFSGITHLNKFMITRFKRGMVFFDCLSVIGIQAIFSQGWGGSESLSQKFFASCPNFYKTIEQNMRVIGFINTGLHEEFR